MLPNAAAHGMTNKRLSASVDLMALLCRPEWVEWVEWLESASTSGCAR